jgi:hypothetical protein
MANDPAAKKIRASRVGKWLLIIVGCLVLLNVALLVALYLLQPRIHTFVRDRARNILESHFKSQIEFNDFDVTLYPRIHVTITKLVMYHKGRRDIPPLIQIEKATVIADLVNLFRAQPHIAHVQLDGFRINTPPRVPGGPPMIHGTDQNLSAKFPVIIDDIHSDDAVIVILRNDNKPPKEFPIHHLELVDFAFDRPAKFHALLTNAVPKGEIDSHGEFGPWDAENPRDTPTKGAYTFDHADLGTIKGIRGILSSVGSYEGPLDYLKVAGTTDTPDFTLRTADHPIPLHTEFSAFVDGTNGDTYLTSVTAHFGHTTLYTSGKIVDENKLIKSRTILLDVVSRDARVEDLIHLAVKTDQPVMTGATNLKAKISIPEANADLIERLKIQGMFLIDDGRFSSTSVQAKVDSLSRRGQGHPAEMDISNVPAKLVGNFNVIEGTISFSDLNFSVVGAAVRLKGSYNLDNEGLDFHGHLVMEARLSQTMTGAKSFFLKIMDPFFKGKNAGTVLPIKIGGTKDHPEFGLDHRSGSDKDEAAPPKSTKETLK